MHGICTNIQFYLAHGRHLEWVIVSSSICLLIPLHLVLLEFITNSVALAFYPPSFHRTEYPFWKKNVAVTPVGAPSALLLSFWCILAEFHCVSLVHVLSPKSWKLAPSIHRGQKFHGINTPGSSLKSCCINTPAPSPLEWDGPEVQAQHRPPEFPVELKPHSGNLPITGCLPCLLARPHFPTSVS